MQVKEALRRRQTIVRLSLPITQEEFQLISLLGTKSNNKGRTKYTIEDLDILATLLGNNWYEYRKNEEDISVVHRDSLYFYLYKHRDIVEYGACTRGHTSLIFCFVKIDKKVR